MIQYVTLGVSFFSLSIILWRFIQVIDSIYFLNFSKCLFLREKKRAGESGGAERKGDRGSKAGSVLTAESPTQSSNSQTMRSWPELNEVGRLTHWATQAPRCPRTLLLSIVCSLLLLSSFPCTIVCLNIHTLKDVWAITNKAPVNIRVWVSVWIWVFISLNAWECNCWVMW